MLRPLALMCLALLVLPVAASAGTTAEAVAAPAVGASASPRVEALLASMSPREKAAQIVIAYPQLDKTGPVQVGGVVYVGGLLKDLDAATAKIAAAKARARIPPFFAVDMEGGSFHRMPQHPDLQALPSAQAMADLSDAEVRQWGARVGAAMKGVGLDLNLAPVLDVAPTGHMRDNERSFSGDAAVVAAKGRAFSLGLLDAGVVPIGKHFPGYGALAGDTDHHLVTAPWSEADLDAAMAPFAQTKDVLGGVMMSNVAYASRGPRPAILDPSLVADGHALGLLTVTDDLAIAALAETVGGDRDAVVREAFLAGNDLLLTTAPPDWDKGVDLIGIVERTAAEAHEHAALLDQAVRRVLTLKERLGLLDGLPAH